MTDIREIVAKAICGADQAQWRDGRYRAGGGFRDADSLNNHWRYKADAALQAIETNGFAIVPVEPDEAMIEAYYDLCCLGGDLMGVEEGCRVTNAYKAMLTAYKERKTHD